MKNLETDDRALLEEKEKQAAIQNQRRKYHAKRRYLRFVVLRRDSFTCQFCGRAVGDGAKLSIDHIVPLSKGGNTSFGNLITACEECNKGKGDVLLARYEIEEFRDLALSNGKIDGSHWLDSIILIYQHQRLRLFS